MIKLLQTADCNISRKVFYITDGQPTNMDFIFNPLRRFIVNKHGNVNSILGVPLKQIQISSRVARKFALINHFLSLVIGKRFAMPSWGLTYMELHKVPFITTIVIQYSSDILYT